MSHVRDLMLGAAIGIALVVVAEHLLGVLSAISIGDAYIKWITAHDVVWLGMMAWYVIVIGIPGMVLPSFIIVFISVWGTRAKWKSMCGAIIAVYIGKFLIDTARTAYEHPGLIELNGYSVFLPSLLLPIGVVAGGFVGSRLLYKATHPASW